MKLFIYSIAITGLFSACRPNTLIDKSYDLKNSQWTYADTLVFPFTAPDTSKIYNIALHIRHRNDYPMQNLYLNIYTAFPDGKRIKQLLNIDLADPSGKWNGKIGRTTTDYDLPIQEGAFFNEPGKHTIVLEQYMRVDPLPGIEKIGLSVDATGQKQ